MSPNAMALLYWKQLLSEIADAPSKTKSDPVGTARASLRCTALVDLFHALLNEMDSTALFEVGAHMAETSHRFVSEAGETPRQALAFEANPSVRDRYLQSRDRPDVEYVDKAIGNAPGPVPFYAPTKPKREIWGSLLKREGFGEVQEISVDMITLDKAWTNSKLKAAPNSAGLWIDVEGAVLDVVKSGKKSLTAHFGVIFAEVYDINVYEESATSIALFALLIEWGFVPLARDNEWVDGWNVIFIHTSQLARVQEVFTRWHYTQAKQIRG